MLKLTGLSEALKSFTGEELKNPKGEILTMKSVLTTQLGSHQGQGVTGDQLIKAYDLGLKIHNAEDAVELDMEQLKFIEGILSKSSMYTSIVMGQVLKAIEQAKVSDKKKEEPKS